MRYRQVGNTLRASLEENECVTYGINPANYQTIEDLQKAVREAMIPPSCLMPCALAQARWECPRLALMAPALALWPGLSRLSAEPRALLQPV